MKIKKHNNGGVLKLQGGTGKKAVKAISKVVENIKGTNKITDLDKIKNRVKITFSDPEKYWYVGHQTGSANFNNIAKYGLQTTNGLSGTAIPLSQDFANTFARGLTKKVHLSHEGSDGLVIMKFPKIKFPSSDLDDISIRLMDLGESKNFEVPSEYLSFIKKQQLENGGIIKAQVGTGKKAVEAIAKTVKNIKKPLNVTERLNVPKTKRISTNLGVNLDKLPKSELKYDPTTGNFKTKVPNKRKWADAAEQMVLDYYKTQEEYNRLLASGATPEKARLIMSTKSTNIQNAYPSRFRRMSSNLFGQSENIGERASITYNSRNDIKGSVPEFKTILNTAGHELGGHGATLNIEPGVYVPSEQGEILLDIYSHNAELKPQLRPVFQAIKDGNVELVKSLSSEIPELYKGGKELDMKKLQNWVNYMEDVQEYSSRAHGANISNHYGFKNGWNENQLKDVFTDESVDKLKENVWGLTLPIISASLLTKTQFKEGGILKAQGGAGKKAAQTIVNTIKAIKKPISEAERLGIPKAERASAKALENPYHWGYQQWNNRYNAAVNSGNVQEAQRLRDLHFKIKAPNAPQYNFYHGTYNKEHPFYIFEPQSNNELFFHFSPYKDTAEKFMGIAKTRNENGRLITAKLNIQHPITVTDSGWWNWYRIPEANPGVAKMLKMDGSTAGQYYNNLLLNGTSASEANGKMMNKLGSDALMYKNYTEDAGRISVAVPKPSQIKLVDPITKTNAGEIIPIVKRDNFHNPDIRYEQGGTLNK